MEQQGQSPPVWDPLRSDYYYFDPQTNQYIYRSGLRLPAPRTLPAAGPSVTTDNQLWQRENQESAYTHQSQRRQSHTSSAAGFQWQAQPSLEVLEQLMPYIPHLAFQSNQLRPQQQQSQGAQPRDIQARRTNTHDVTLVTAIDTTTAVQTAFVANRSGRITDPVLARQGLMASRLLLPTPGSTERLYKEYTVRPGRRFFVVGRIFLVLWVEPAGENARSTASAVTIDPVYEPVRLEDPGILPGRYGTSIYSKVRRFVVIREGRNYCSALPIVSYGQRGVGKPGVVKSEHGIIYTSREPPSPMDSERPGRHEQGMRQQAIRVVPDVPTDALDPRSRIDFAKIYTIHHNIKVKPFGKVHRDSVTPLLTTFSNVFGTPAGLLRPVTVPDASSSSATDAMLGEQMRQMSLNSTAVDDGGEEEEDEEGYKGAKGEEGDDAGDTDFEIGRRQYQHRTALTTYEAYGQLLQGDHPHTPEEAFDALTQSLRRLQPSLTEEQARSLLQSRLAYARAHLAKDTQ